MKNWQNKEVGNCRAIERGGSYSHWVSRTLGNGSRIKGVENYRAIERGGICSYWVSRTIIMEAEE